MTEAGRVVGDTEGPGARQRILEAAETLFAEQGYDRTSTASIAAAAGVPNGLVFYHYRSKLDLLLAVVRNDSRTGDDLAFPTVRRNASLRTHITAIWNWVVATLGAPSAVRRIVLQEMSAHPEVRSRALELQTAFATAVAERIARASGHDGPPRPEHIAAATVLTMAAAMASVYDLPAGSVVDVGALARLLEPGLRGAG